MFGGGEETGGREGFGSGRLRGVLLGGQGFISQGRTQEGISADGA